MDNLEARAAAVHKLVGCAGCVDPEMLELSADPLPASDETALRLGPTKVDVMTQQTQLLDPGAVHSGDGEARWWFEGLAVVKATAADTGGQMTILEITEPPDWEGPLHVHHREDEGFWILEGSATFEVGDQTIEARDGDYLFGPRGIPHRFTTGPDGCRMLFIFTPGGFEELLRATSRPAQRRTLPPPGDDAPPSEEDVQAMHAAIQAYGCELLD